MITLTDDTLDISVTGETEKDAKRLFSAERRRVRKLEREQDAKRDKAHAQNAHNALMIGYRIDEGKTPAGWCAVRWDAKREYGRSLAAHVTSDGAFTIIPLYSGSIRFYRSPFVCGLADASGIIAACLQDGDKTAWYLVSAFEGVPANDRLPLCLAKQLEKILDM